MRRPAAHDFEAQIAPALEEDRALRSDADAVQRPLDAEDMEAARAALPALNASLEQAHLTQSARRSARQAVR